jgi:S-adenosylmethionine:tRNA ribosyltransferase-isomerase
VFGDDLRGTIIDRVGDQEVLIDFSASSEDMSETLDRVGYMPIPPYIRNGVSDGADKADYQSLFAEDTGSIAAPTASLHFTPAVLDSFPEHGIETVTITLHVGTASFLPLTKAGQTGLAAPGSEEFSVSDEAWELIQTAKQAGRRVVAVGTTVVRALESRAIGIAAATDLFITPGFTFQVCDAIITNFHQPATTHLLLVQAFIGRSLLDTAYQYALDNDFRFLSYGDGMLLQQRKGDEHE